MAENVTVSVRVRPLNEKEKDQGCRWEVRGNSLRPIGVEGSLAVDAEYALDHVFDVDTNTDSVYAARAKDLVHSVVAGFNSTILAYGQTSSGKTHTMMGAKDAPGIIPMAVYDVFRHIERSAGREFLLRVSYMEIYNEKLRDLLSGSVPGKLQILENADQGVFVAGLTEEIVKTPEQVLQIMHRGETKRTFGETQMNQHSSRSHTVFRMVVESRNTEGENSLEPSNTDSVRVSALTLVDLAGSERQSKTGADGERLKEGSHINKSLLCLGTVISKLSEGIEAQGGHIPYRDSKLTRILQPSLGGNARTLVICNVTPSALHVDETHSTLRFATRAKRVTNNAKVNEVVSEKALLRKQQLEIAELKEKLAEGRHCKDGEVALTKSQEEQIQARIMAMRANVMAAEEDKLLMAMQLEEQEALQRKQQEQMSEYVEKIEQLKKLVLVSSKVLTEDGSRCPNQKVRRKTWYPGTTGNGPALSDSMQSSGRLSSDSSEETQDTGHPGQPVWDEIANYKANAESLRGRLDHAKDENAELLDEVELLRAENREQRIRLEQMEGELLQSSDEKSRLEDVEERLRMAQARVAALLEENEGFEAHIHELEMQRRAPLYNKRQEEELRRTQERVQELELELSAVTAETGTLSAEMEATKAAMLAATAECDCAKATNQKLLLELDFSRKEARRHETDADRELQERRRLSIRVQELVSEMEEKTREYEGEISSIRAFLEEKEEQGKILEERLEETTKNLSSTQEELSESCARVESLNAQLGDIEKKFQSKVSDLESVLSENEALKGEVGSLRELNEELQSKLSSQPTHKPSFGPKSGIVDASSLRAEISRLSRELKAAELKPKLMEKEKERICREMDKLKDKYQKQDMKMRSLMQEKLTAISEKTSIEREAKRLKDQNALYKSKLEKKEEARQNIEKLKAELSSNTTRVHSLEMDIQGANAKIKDLTEEKNSLSTVLGERDCTIDALNSERGQIRVELSELQDTHRKLEGEHRVTCTKLEASRKKVEYLSGEVSDLEEKNKDLQGKLSQLESDHQKAKCLLEECMASLESASRQHAEASMKLEQEQASGAALQNRNAELESALAQSRAALQDATERLPLIAELQGKVAELEISLQHSVEDFNREKQQRQEEGDASQVMIEDLNSNVLALQEKLSASTSQISDLEQSLDRCKEEMEALKDSRERAVGSYHAASAELAAISDLLETERNLSEEAQATMKQEICDLRAEQINLQIQLNASRDDAKGARNAAVLKEKEFAEKQEEFLMSSSDLQEVLQMKDTILAEMHERAHELQIMIEKHKDENKSLENRMQESIARENLAVENLNRLRKEVYKMDVEMQSREGAYRRQLLDSEKALQHAKECELSMREELSVTRAEAQQQKLKYERETERSRTELQAAQHRILKLAKELESFKSGISHTNQVGNKGFDHEALSELQQKHRVLLDENRRLMQQVQSVGESSSQLLKLREEVHALSDREKENEKVVKNLRSSLERLEAEKLTWGSSGRNECSTDASELEQLRADKHKLSKELKERRRQIHKMQEVYVSLKQAFQDRSGLPPEAFDEIRAAKNAALELRETNVTLERLRRDNAALRDKVEKYRGLYRRSGLASDKENALE